MKLLLIAIALVTLTTTSEAQIFKGHWRPIFRHHRPAQKCYNCQPPQQHYHQGTPMVRVKTPSGGVVVAQANICVDERNAYEAADAQVTTNVIAREQSRQDVAAATEAVAAAQAILDAANADLAQATTEYQAASAAVVESTAAASAAYQAWIDCITGGGDG